MKFDLLNFPHLRGVVAGMAASNGIVNRFCSTSKVYSAAEQALCADGVPLEDVQRLEGWLDTLNSEQLDTLEDGEQSDIDELARHAPAGIEGESVTKLLDDIYEALTQEAI